MFLKPPGKDSKPLSNRSTKGALSNKKPEKPKAFKTEGNETAPPTPKEDTEFSRWIKQQGGNFGVHRQQAFDYLVEGIPYRGDSLFESKDTLRNMGARFCWNPNKKKDCIDKTIRRGWWAAYDEKVLRKLLDMDRVPSMALRGRQWQCLGLGETQMKLVIAWLDEFAALSGTPAAESKIAGLRGERRWHEGGQPAEQQMTKLQQSVEAA